MEEEEYKHYIKAGKILGKVHQKARGMISPGMKLLEIAEKIEKEIIELEGKPAFPVNLSLNNSAAHYTPAFDEETTIEEKDLLKVDIGVHVEGFIADYAFTLDFSGKNEKLVEAAEKALEKAFEEIKVGAKIGGIGKTIEETIHSYDFNPIQNLSGHGLSEYRAHYSPSIPNIGKKDEREIEEGKAYAIEPFACNGLGFVKEAPQTQIFEFNEVRPLRNLEARKILDKVLEEYKTLPFAERWLVKEFGSIKTKIALRELLQRECLSLHPILREEKNVLVSQAENSFIAKDKEIIKLVE
ncbi:MAG: type II methionyl aminopeptidase [Candidatus Diapherotrites archaeon]